MNIHSKDMKAPRVTTGPLPASRKVYASPQGHEQLKVPLREIALAEGAQEPDFRVYDTSGPYSDSEATIDVEQGLARIR